MMSVQHAADSRDFDAIVALVMRSAREECGPDGCPIHSALNACAREAVGLVWGSPVPSFVPLLALRHVRCCIRAGTCDCGDC